MFRLIKRSHMSAILGRQNVAIIHTELNSNAMSQNVRLHSSKITEIDYNQLKSDDSSITHYEKTDMPVEMENPYKKEKLECLLCKLKITPDYRNVRLLSQFVSRFTGRVYGPHITGLCKAQQECLEREVKKAHNAGLMPAYFRDPRFAHDPLLFDPDFPFRPHRF